MSKEYLIDHAGITGLDEVTSANLLSHDCMIDDFNSFVTEADALRDIFHLPACFARVAHLARACTLSRLFGDLVVSFACCCSGSDCVRVVTSAHQRSGSCTSGSLGVV